MGTHPIETAILDVVGDLSGALYVGYSGGLDSTALLLATHAVRPDVIAIHANHQLNDDADAWQAHCEAVCGASAIALQTQRLVVGPGNLEAQARAARYAYFADVVGEGTLLLGHHADDYAETALLRLFQGRGLMNMEPDGRVGQGRFVRPLLKFRKSELTAYLATRSADWIEDSSNRDERFDRNFLRHEIIPRLRARWPGLTQGIVRSSSTAMASAKVLRREMGKKPNVVEAHELPDARDERLEWLRAYLGSRGHFNVTDKALLEFERQLAVASACELDLGHGLLGGFKGRVFFEATRPRPMAPMSGLALGDRIDLGWAELCLRTAAADERGAFGCSPSLNLRFRRGGERLRPDPARAALGLKDLLANAGVPPWRRAAYPLIFDGDDLVCIPGVATVGAGAAEGWCIAELVEK